MITALLLCVLLWLVLFAMFGWVAAIMMVGFLIAVALLLWAELRALEIAEPTGEDMGGEVVDTWEGFEQARQNHPAPKGEWAA